MIWAGLAGLAALGAGSLAATGAAPRQVSTIYDLYLGGIRAGEMTVDAHYEGGRYRANSVLRTAGVVGFFYKASFEAETEGTLTDTGHTPDRFAAHSRMREKQQYVEMTYAHAAPAGVRAEPAFVPKPWEIDPTDQSGTTDPITAAVAYLAPRPRADICNRTVEIFDGRKRYAIVLGAPEADGDRIRCPALYRRIAGFKPKMMRERPEFPFHMWFEERADGLTHFVRAAGDSMFGVAVILLRQ